MFGMVGNGTGIGIGRAGGDFGMRDRREDGTGLHLTMCGEMIKVG